jgi:uncharacterized membrane protein
MTSITQTFSAPGAVAPRWLLFASLALNLFFVGVGAALLIRQPAPLDRSTAGRIERLAATLPAADAGKLRGKFQAQRAAVEDARERYDAARDTIRGTLRREPFQLSAMQEAMTRARAARQNFDQELQTLLANAAAEMSPEGRERLAEWPPGQPRGRPAGQSGR